MKPILFSFFGVKILSYTVFSFLAIIASIFYIIKNLQKQKIKIDYFDYLFWTILFGALGSKIIYIVLYPNQFDFSIFYSGGAVSWGGIFFGCIAAILYLKKHHLPISKILDISIFGLFIGIAIGRIGSFLNGDGYGKIIDLWIGVKIPKVDLSPRYPAEIFESMALIILLITLYLIKKKQKFQTPGLISLIIFSFYFMIRFINDFFKDNFHRYCGLTFNQIFCLFGIGVIIIFIIWRKHGFWSESRFFKSTKRKIRKKFEKT